MYNYARIAEIKRKYNEATNSGYYPQLPPVESIDFSVLTGREAWELLFDFLLEYPVILENIVERAEEGEIQHHLLLRFIFGLCEKFSLYYSRHRILQVRYCRIFDLITVRVLILIFVCYRILNHICYLACLRECILLKLFKLF